MTQYELNQALADVSDEILESINACQDPHQTITQIGIVIRNRLAGFAQHLVSSRPDDISIQIGKTRIKVRITKSPYSESQSRALALSTAQYLVRSLATGRLSQFSGDWKLPVAVTDPSVADMGSAKTAG